MVYTVLITLWTYITHSLSLRLSVTHYKTGSSRWTLIGPDVMSKMSIVRYRYHEIGTLVNRLIYDVNPFL